MKINCNTRTELQRLLSKRGIASRSQAALLITAGRVSVNGKIIKDPRTFISINAIIAIDSVIIPRQPAAKTLLIAFHKPKGVVTTASDEKGRKTAYDVLPPSYSNLKAVGRLDMATTGLLLFTNDSILADQLLDPENNIPRTYVVTVKGQPSAATLEKMKQGIRDGKETLSISSYELRKISKKESTLILTLREGKNREIRRLCLAVGHEVIKLKRISFGPIHLEDLPIGKTREISDAELRAVREQLPKRLREIP